jgi:ATP-dependent Lon protease
VRQLERELGKLLRKTATRIASGKVETPVELGLDEVRDALGRQKFYREAAERTAVPGVATGLAVTGTGGDVLFVEATSSKGDKLVLTGQLGDVMKESVQIALSSLRSRACRARDRGGRVRADLPCARSCGRDPEGRAERRDHDGDRSGVAALRRPVKHTIGMTGEVTLQGRVLPIGGLKQKVLAAHAAGLTDVILPERNRQDLDDVPEHVRDEMTFHPVMSLDEVLELALEPANHLHAV